MSIFSTLLSLKLPLVMGVLNITPDSFFDGGQFNSVDRALTQAQIMEQQGAVIIDVGGESTRPGADDVSADDEIMRVVPVISAIRAQSDISISIDTSKPEVMKAAVKAGANFINDVNGLRAQDALVVCADLNVPVCLMHMLGQPRTMQLNPQYENVVEDVINFFEQRIQACLDAGIKLENMIIDPGFGFGKSIEHNLQLLNRLNELMVFNMPILVGLSRKSMLGKILGDNTPENRLHASVAAAIMARSKGARIFRVHDVKPTVDALLVCDAVTQERLALS